LACGDGVCGDDESSATCPLDCKVVKRKSYVWLFWVFVSVLFGGIFVVGFFFFKRMKSNSSKNANNSLNNYLAASRPITPARSSSGLRMGRRNVGRNFRKR